MKKKKRLNSKIIFTITMVFVLCCFMSTSLWAQYCQSSGGCYHLYITRVKVADLDNPSLRDYPTCYSDFTHLTAHLTQGKTFSVELENSMSWDPIYWKIWIDYNDDEDFDDDGENVFSGYGGHTVNGSISVPCSTIIGDTRMRVSLGTSETNLAPCGAIGFGEVEDYTVNIADSPDLEYTVGNTTVFGSTSKSDYRRAMPFTMPEDGTINSVTMYHEASTSGSYKMILGVYADDNGSPGDRLGKTDETLVDNIADWQTIELQSPTEVVTGGTTVWLAWVYENNPGIRYQSGSSGRYQSGETWLSGMPDPFGAGSQADYIYSIYATYTTPGCTFGYSDVFTDDFDRDPRRAQPFIMPEDGTINSISMYHEGGTGSDQMILAVYEGEGFPQYRIAKTPATVLSTEDDWQDIALESPVFVEGGTNICLAWVYESEEKTTMGIRRQSGFPGAFVSGAGWPLRMPELFGCSEPEGYIYSIYAKYTPGGSGEPPYKRVGITQEYPIIGNDPNRHAQPFTMPETGCIKSVSMYHYADVGDTSMILGVYYSDDEGKPGAQAGVTVETPVCRTAGWQTIELTSPPVLVTEGTKIWLAWVYESNPGIRYRGGLPGEAYRSNETWSGGMPVDFGNSTQTNLVYSIFANYTPGETSNCTCGTATVGNTDVFGSTSTSVYRRAMPFTMPENGTICSVSMYHEGGCGYGKMILGVYDGNSSPENRLAVTQATPVNHLPGWQGICLTSPAFVSAGSTIWLAWVYESNPGIRYQSGSPGRFQSGDTWSGGMPDPFGSGSQANYIYSIYASYIPD